MRIGVWISENYKPEVGGGFSYFDRLLHAIDEYDFGNDIQICYVTRSDELFHLQHEVIRLKTTPICYTLKDKILRKIPGLRKKIRTKYRILNESRIRNNEQCILKASNIAFIYYPTDIIYQVENYPFVATNWDIGHLSTYAFPEVCMDGEFERRSNIYTNQLPKAILTCCESEAGKHELIKFTNIDASKIRVVPLFAGNTVECVVDDIDAKRFLESLGLEKERYFFYPAQFWAHKNHVNLLLAFAEFRATHHQYKLVLTGSDKGNQEYIEHIVKDLGIEKSVIFPGFVSMECINTLYRYATSLIMASYFGPTNIPPLEAMELGCPVIASDIAGHREQLGDGALYFDAINFKSMLHCMESIVENRPYYKNAISNQKIICKFTIEYALSALSKALHDAMIIRRSWR